MHRCRAKIPWLACAVFIGALSAAPLHSQVPTEPAQVSAYAHLDQLQTAFTTLSESLAPSVVSIRSYRRLSTIHGRNPFDDVNDADFYTRRDRLVAAAGSGVVIRADGKILTNEHVVQGAERIQVVLHDGRSFDAVALHTDIRSDLAVVTIEARDLSPARYGDLSRVRRGHWAIAMGNPYGYAEDGHAAMTYGIVSALGRSLPELDPSPSQRRYYGNLIQTDAEINPGNSGGPLFNLEGEMIGINTAISTRSGSSDGVGFAVPISARTRSIIDRLIHGQSVTYGYLGVKVENRSDSKRQGGIVGAKIKEVVRDSAAYRATLRQGDRILRFNGAVVHDGDDLVRLVGATIVGDAVPVEYERGDQIHTCKVRLDERDIGPSDPDRLLFIWRGMSVGAVDDARRKRFRLDDEVEGLVITDVEPGSIAEQAGLEEGTILDRVNGTAVSRLDLLRRVAAGSKGEVEIVVDDETVTLPPDDK